MATASLKTEMTPSSHVFPDCGFGKVNLWKIIENYHYLSSTFKAPYAIIADFANTVDPDETAHNEPSHLDLQCLPSSL